VTGSAIGVTVAGAVFQNLLASGLDKRLAGESPEAQVWVERVRVLRLKQSFEAVKDVPEPWRGKIVAAFVEALHGVWWFCGGLSGLWE